MIWITGNSGAGKTTLAKKLKKDNTIILDGDELRECWKLGFSKDDRWEQNLRAAKLANLLEKQGFEVIVATICPYKKLREVLSLKFTIKWTYLEGGKEPTEEFPYER